MSDKKVALITGASAGIGYATALEFARQGTHVVGTARRSERLVELGEKIDALESDCGEFLPVTADVQNADAMFNVVEQALTKFGRLDILVANAGVGHRGGIVAAEWDDLQTLLRTNIDGVLHSIRAAVPAIRKHKQGGHIIIVSSVTHNGIVPYAATYAASKAFVNSIGRSLQMELKDDNIRVTNMLIGRTESEFSQKRLGKPGRSSGGIPVMPTEKVAKAIVKASQSKRKAVALRWIDRFILLGNMLVPGFVGRKAIKQYK